MGALGPFEITDQLHASLVNNQVFVRLNVQPTDADYDTSGTVYKPRRDIFYIHKEAFEASIGGGGDPETLPDRVFSYMGLDRSADFYVIAGGGGHGLGGQFTIFKAARNGVLPTPSTPQLIADLLAKNSDLGAVNWSGWLVAYGRAVPAVVVLSQASGGPTAHVTADEIESARASGDARDWQRFIAGLSNQLRP